MEAEPRPEETTAEAQAASRRRPFQRIRFRSLVFWLLVGLVPGFLAFVAFALALGIEPADPLALVFLMDVVYAVGLGWVLVKFRGEKVDLRGILGRHPDARLLPEVLAIVFALLLLSVGCLMALYYPFLTLTIPAVEAPSDTATPPDASDSDESKTDRAEADSPQLPSLTGANSRYPTAALFLSVFTIVVFVPFVEELLFRGVLLHRWTVKWNLPSAVFFSSLIFGLGHFTDPIGKFVFGVMMSFLYLKTGSLILPIFCHMFHNGMVLLFMPEPGAGSPASEAVGEGVGFEIQVVLLGILFLFVSVPLVLHFLKKYRPESPWPPYFRSSNEEGGSRPEDASAPPD
jgi:membrane protease YdiL (CAAX protease family)